MAIAKATIQGLTNDTEYGVRVFVEGKYGYQTALEGATARVAPRAYSIFGVRIDQANPDPEAAVTYTDDAVGMTPGSADWDSLPIFNGIKPCLFKDGQVVGYLNPNNFAQFEDGTAADITSGNAGDVMIEFPKTGFKIETVGDVVTVQITDDSNAGSSGFRYYAHTRETEGDREKLYIGAYLGYVNSSKLYSLSGKTPSTNSTIGSYISKAISRGTGYDIWGFYPLTFVQSLYLVKYKNRNSQLALGRGLTHYGMPKILPTGGTNDAGMCYGETSGERQMKLFGLEDFWGNRYQLIGGLYSNSSFEVFTAFKNFNDTGAGYISRGIAENKQPSSWLSKVQGTTDMGFITKETVVEADYYYTDSAKLGTGFPMFGGDSGDTHSAGVFHLYANTPATYYHTGCGTRLMYL